MKVSNERYHLLADHMTDIIFLMDMDFRVTYQSPSSEKLRGYTTEELRNIPLEKNMTTESLQRALEMFYREIPMIQIDPLYNPVSFIDLEYYRKDGTTVWLENRFSVIRNSNGQPVSILGEGRDITERKLTEEKLRLSENQFRGYVENTPIGVFVCDETGRYVQVNPAATTITGYTSEELLAFSILDILPPDSQVLVGHFFQVVSETGHVSAEFAFRHKDGHIGMWSLEGVRLSPNRFMGLVADISERKQAEEKVKKSEAQLANAIDISKLGSWEYDVASVTFTFNDHFYAVFRTTVEREGGYTMTSAQYAQRFVHADDMLLVGIETRKAIETTDPNFSRRLEHRVIYADGETGYINVRFFIIKDAQGRTVKTYGVNQDITERKKAEQELIIAKDRAEESDRLKSAFLANMSHEIRTPMNGILGFASLLKEPDLSGQEQQQFIRMIEKSGARMLNIINDIIDISKIESGQVENSISETNINDQIEYMYSFFKPEVERKNLQFSFKNSLPAKESIINTDREKIFAILTNLVKNAAKFTEEGSIEFGYNLVETDNYPSLQFFVKDTGIGIPKNKQEVIFERFAQADVFDTKALQGAGLGLSISKAYVEILGGKIWVESEEGKGSVFYFTIPYIPEPKEKAVLNTVAPADEVLDQVKKLKPLIAEDDEASELFISTVVKKISKEVLSTKSGLDAVDISRNNPDIDLILMDIQLPEMNGYEATRQIRQFNEDVIIIAQTAFALTGEREKAIEAGCNDYISKPINKDELGALIQKYFQK